MQTQPMLRAALAAALLTTLGGCYNLGINSQGIKQPISMSNAIGRPFQVSRHFKYDLVTWYGFGMIPLATVPGAVPTWTPADKLVTKLLQDELAKGGQGIVNLRVVQQVTPLSFVASVVPAFVPIIGGLVSATLQPIGVTIEGDVVTFGGRSAVPGTGMVTLQDGEIDLNGVDLRALVVAASKTAESKIKSR